MLGGASGLIGGLIIEWFGQKDVEIVALSRSSKPVKGATRTVQWDGKSFSGWEKEFDGAELAINLSGKSLFTRWTDSNLAQIRNSRIDTTLAFGEAIEVAKNGPSTWINSSAIGYYGDTGSAEKSEASPKGQGFMPDLCEEWEQAALRFSNHTRVVPIRTGIVLSMKGGMLPLLNRLTKFFIGGAVCPGNQYISWIHERDMARSIECLAMESDLHGPGNAVAPNPVTNAEFMKELRSLHSRPWVPPAPEIIMRAASKITLLPTVLVLESQRVAPEILLGRGFKFEFPTLQQSLADLCDDSPDKWAPRSTPVA